VNPDTGLVEIMGIEDHPFFSLVCNTIQNIKYVANPHPIFCELCSCCKKKEIISVYQKIMKFNFFVSGSDKQ
jgi:hypothetical protein